MLLHACRQTYCITKVFIYQKLKGLLMRNQCYTISLWKQIFSRYLQDFLICISVPLNVNDIWYVISFKKKRSRRSKCKLMHLTLHIIGNTPYVIVAFKYVASYFFFHLFVFILNDSTRAAKLTNRHCDNVLYGKWQCDSMTIYVICQWEHVIDKIVASPLLNI